MANILGGGGANAGGGRRFQTLRSNPPLPTVFRHISGGSGFATTARATSSAPLTVPADCQNGDEIFWALVLGYNNTNVYPSTTTPAGWEIVHSYNVNPNTTNLYTNYTYRAVVGQGGVTPGSTHTATLTSTSEVSSLATIIRPPAGAPATPASRSAAFGTQAGGAQGSTLNSTPAVGALAGPGSVTTYARDGYRGLQLIWSSGSYQVNSNGLTAAHLSSIVSSISWVRGTNSGIDRISNPISLAASANGSSAGNGGSSVSPIIGVAVVQADNIVGASLAPPLFTQPAGGMFTLIPQSHISVIPGIDARVSVVPLHYTKSAWQQIFASTQFPSTDLLLEFQPRSVSATSAASTLLTDIAVGPAGDEQIVAADLAASDVALTTYVPNGPIRLSIPLRIPAGSRVSVRSYLEATATVPSYAVNATLVG